MRGVLSKVRGSTLPREVCITYWTKQMLIIQSRCALAVVDKLSVYVVLYTKANVRSIKPKFHASSLFVASS